MNYIHNILIEYVNGLFDIHKLRDKIEGGIIGINTDNNTVRINEALINVIHCINDYINNQSDNGSQIIALNKAINDYIQIYEMDILIYKLH